MLLRVYHELAVILVLLSASRCNESFLMSKTDRTPPPKTQKKRKKKRKNLRQIPEVEGSSSATPLHKLLSAGCERGMPHCRQTCSFTSVCVGWGSILSRILMTHQLARIQRSVCHWAGEPQQLGLCSQFTLTHQNRCKGEISLSVEIAPVNTTAKKHGLFTERRNSF